MKIKLLQDYRVFKKGEEFEIKPNAINYWMGKNGTGKSTLASLILTFLQKNKKSLVPSQLWMATQTKHDLVDITGWEKFDGLTFFSDKLRQTQMVDMSALIEMGLGRIWASEGQNSQQDVVEMAKHFNKPNHLVILDEIDGHLDYPSKVLLFEMLLNRIQGTVIVITHDSLFMRGREVFDFEDRKFKTGDSYYEHHLSTVLNMKAEALERNKKLASKKKPAKK